MQWAHLPPRKKRTRTFLPSAGRRGDQVLPVVSCRENGSAGKGDQTSGPSVVRSIRSIAASSVPRGGLGSAGSSRSCRPSSRRRSARAGGRPGGRGRPAGPAARACDRPPGRPCPCRRRGGSRPGRPAAGPGSGFCVDGLPGDALGEAEVAGGQVGAGQRLGPHRRGLGELLERRADLALGQQLVALQLGQRAAFGARRLFDASLRASICSASFAVSPLAA